MQSFIICSGYDIDSLQPAAVSMPPGIPPTTYNEQASGGDGEESSLWGVFRHYSFSKQLKRRSSNEIATTLRKWQEWSDWRSGGQPVGLRGITAEALRAFLCWRFETAEGENPGLVHNKSRAHLRALLRFARDEGAIREVPKMPPERPAREVAGLYWMTDEEVSRLYWSTFDMAKPYRWKSQQHVGVFWRAAIVLAYNYAMDTQTLFPYMADAKPLLVRHVSLDRVSPDRQSRIENDFGWLTWQRCKTGKVRCMPMNQVVYEHVRAVLSVAPGRERALLIGGTSRPCRRFQQLCESAGIDPKIDQLTGDQKKWTLKDLRKTSASAHDHHRPGSATAVMGHYEGSISYKHYANRDHGAARSVLELPQPEAFRSIYDTSIKRPF